MRKILRERSRNLNREVWESPSVYGGEDVKIGQKPDLAASTDDGVEDRLDGVILDISDRYIDESSRLKSYLDL